MSQLGWIIGIAALILLSPILKSNVVFVWGKVRYRALWWLLSPACWVIHHLRIDWCPTLWVINRSLGFNDWYGDNVINAVARRILAKER